MDSPEQAGNTADTATDHVVFPFQITLVLSVEHPNEPETTLEPELFVDDMPGTVPPDEILSNEVLLPDFVLNNIPNVEISSKYELPARSTRGVPPKRYDPEYELQRSWYPINQSSDESLSLVAMAFNTSLYSSTLPKNVEEAL